MDAVRQLEQLQSKVDRFKSAQNMCCGQHFMLYFVTLIFIKYVPSDYLITDHTIFLTDCGKAQRKTRVISGQATEVGCVGVLLSFKVQNIDQSGKELCQLSLFFLCLSSSFFFVHCTLHRLHPLVSYILLYLLSSLVCLSLLCLQSQLRVTNLPDQIYPW